MLALDPFRIDKAHLARLCRQRQMRMLDAALDIACVDIERDARSLGMRDRSERQGAGSQAMSRDSERKSIR
jgi:hypothetical protein